MFSFVTLLFVAFGHIACRGATYEADFDVLEQLYLSANGDTWAWPTSTGRWNFSGGYSADMDLPCTEWFGITCNGTAGSCGDSGSICMVTGLNLTHLNLTGTLAAQIGDFYMLSSLTLPGNEIQGPLPTSLATLSSLEVLHLSFNFLSGHIPAGWDACALKELKLVANNLDGELPSSLYGCSLLNVLNVHSNYLTANLSMLPLDWDSMHYFDVSYNYIHGIMPQSTFCSWTHIRGLNIAQNWIEAPALSDCLCDLGELLYLELFYNSIGGPIPSCLTAMPLLRRIDLSNNLMTGELPISYGPSLERLLLLKNSFSGKIPTSIAQAQSLKSLELSSNKFSGTLPSVLADLSALEILLFNINKITGTLPTTLSNLTNLELFYVSSNSLHGNIPNAYYDNMLRLVDFRANDNQITGTLPTAIGKLTRLAVFDVTLNFLEGTIPSEVGNLTDILYLLLYVNKLTGTLPTTLGNCDLLLYLKLDTNSISGSIPSEFEGLLLAMQITLYENRLTGTVPTLFQTLPLLDNLQMQSNFLTGKPGQSFSTPIPSFSLRSIDVSNNRFTGTIPYEFFLLSSIRTIAAVSNCFSGSLTSEICNVAALEVLAFDGLDSSPNCQRHFGIFSESYISRASVSGSIPNCIWNLPNLTTLHLSGNRLKGSLSGAVVISPTTSSLQNLSLSYNRLTGTIPDSIQEWRNFKSIDLSKNDLGGSIAAMNGMLQPASYCDSLENNNCTLLTLDSNRLSGDIPPTFTTAYGLDILSGNLFQCNQHNIPQEDPRRNGYICGSLTLDVSLVCFGVLAAVAGLAILSVKILTKRSVKSYLTARPDRFSKESAKTSEGSVSVIKGQSATDATLSSKRSSILDEVKLTAERFSLWLGAIGNRSHFLQRLEGLANYLDLLVHIRYTCLVLLGLIWAINAPLYSFVKQKSRYSTHMYQYSWYVSSALMQGYMPAAIMAASWFVILFSFLYFMIKVKRLRSKDRSSEMQEPEVSREKSPEPAPRPTGLISQSPEPEEELYQHVTFVTPATNVRPDASRPNAFTRVMWLTVASIVNGIIVLAAKGFYLYIVLDGSTSYIITIFAQMGLAAFDLIWNWTVVGAFLNWFAMTTGMSGSRLIMLKVLVYMFNSVAAPCLVAAVSDPDCIRDWFQQQPAVSSTYSYQYCYTVELGATGRCPVENTAFIYTSYQPPFVYDFQCGSAMITDYVPVFMFIYIFTGLLVPLLFLIVLCIGPRKLPVWFASKMPGIFWPGEGDNITVNSSMSRSRGTTFVIDTTTKLCESLAKPDAVVSSLMHHFVVFFTFGIAYPPLAIVIAVSVVSLVLFWQSLIGRYLLHYESHPDTATMISAAAPGVSLRSGGRGGSKAADLVPAHLVVLQREVLDAWKGSRSSARLLTIGSSVFYGFFFFDITSGEIGWQQAIAFPIVLILTPLVIFRLIRSKAASGTYVLPIVGTVVISRDFKLDDVEEDDDEEGSRTVTGNLKKARWYGQNADSGADRESNVPPRNVTTVIHDYVDDADLENRPTVVSRIGSFADSVRNSFAAALAPIARRNPASNVQMKERSSIIGSVNTENPMLAAIASESGREE